VETHKNVIAIDDLSMYGSEKQWIAKYALNGERRWSKIRVTLRFWRICFGSIAWKPK
jgi:hypothetical protein